MPSKGRYRWNSIRALPAGRAAATCCTSTTHAYTAEVLSDEALEAAMAPITAWCDSRLELEEFTELANACLDGTADQWATLRVVLELAEIKHQPSRKS